MKDPKPRNPHAQLSASALGALGKLLANPILNAPVFEPGRHAPQLDCIEITPKRVPPLAGGARKTFVMGRLEDLTGTCSKCQRQGMVLTPEITKATLCFQMVDGAPRLYCMKCIPKGMTRHIHSMAR